MARRSIQYVFAIFIQIAAVHVAVAASGSTAGFTGIGELPNGSNTLADGANYVSGDGITVDGSAFTTVGQVGFIWTAGTGIQFVPFPQGSGNSSQGTNGISATGEIVGGAWGPNTVPFTYTPATGSIALPGPTPATADAISPDGTLIAGATGATSQQFVVWNGAAVTDLGITFIANTSEACGISNTGHILAGTTSVNGSPIAFEWTAGNGVSYLPGPSLARSISTNGNVVVGQFKSASGLYEPAEWTASIGWTLLGDLFGEGGLASNVSADGSVIVGYENSPTGEQAFIWTQARGMQLLDNVLTTDGVTNVSSWNLQSANDISANASTIVGEGIDPAGNYEGWVATVPVPEPASGGMLLAFAAVLSAARRRRQKLRVIASKDSTSRRATPV